MKGAWKGPAALQRFQHRSRRSPACGARSDFRVRIQSDLALGLGTVVHDYLAK
ncbi:MAG: hypothetical protein ABI624_16020 [Casimicrobiaceae bacterium]